jgi:hypothetical protein
MSVRIYGMRPGPHENIEKRWKSKLKLSVSEYHIKSADDSAQKKVGSDTIYYLETYIEKTISNRINIAERSR